MNWTSFWLGATFWVIISELGDFIRRKIIGRERRKCYRIEESNGCFYVYMFDSNKCDFGV